MTATSTSSIVRKINAILQRKGDVYRPVAAFGSVPLGIKNDGTQVVDWDSLLYHPYEGFFPDCFRRSRGRQL